MHQEQLCASSLAAPVREWRCCSQRLLACEVAAALQQLGARSLTTVALTLSAEEQQSRNPVGTATVHTDNSAQLPAGLQHLAKHHWTGGVYIEGQDVVIILHKPGPRPAGLPYAAEPGSSQKYRAASLSNLHPDDRLCLLQHGITSGQYNMQLLVDGKLHAQPFTVQLSVTDTDIALTAWDEPYSQLQEELSGLFDCGYRLQWRPHTAATGGHPSGYSLLKMATSKAPMQPYLYSEVLWSVPEGCHELEVCQAQQDPQSEHADQDSPMSDAQLEFTGSEEHSQPSDEVVGCDADQLRAICTQDEVEAADLLLSLQSDPLGLSVLQNDALPVAGRKRAHAAAPVANGLHDANDNSTRCRGNWNAGAVAGRGKRAATMQYRAESAVNPAGRATGWKKGYADMVTKHVNHARQGSLQHHALRSTHGTRGHAQAQEQQQQQQVQQQVQQGMVGCRQSTRLSIKRARAQSHDSGASEMTAMQVHAMQPAGFAASAGDIVREAYGGQPADLPAQDPVCQPPDMSLPHVEPALELLAAVGHPMQAETAFSDPELNHSPSLSLTEPAAVCPMQAETAVAYEVQDHDFSLLCTEPALEHPEKIYSPGVVCTEVAVTQPGQRQSTSLLHVEPAVVTTAQIHRCTESAVTVTTQDHNIRLPHVEPGVVTTGPMQGAGLPAKEAEAHRARARVQAKATRAAVQPRTVASRRHRKSGKALGAGVLVTTEVVHTVAHTSTEVLTTGAVTTSLNARAPQAARSALQRMTAGVLQCAVPAVVPQQESNELAEWLEHRIKSHGGSVRSSSEPPSSSATHIPSGSQPAVSNAARVGSCPQQISSGTVQQAINKEGASRSDIAMTHCAAEAAASEGGAAAWAQAAIRHAAAQTAGRMRHCPPPGVSAAVEGHGGPYCLPGSSLGAKAGQLVQQQANRAAAQPTPLARIRHPVGVPARNSRPPHVAQPKQVIGDGVASQSDSCKAQDEEAIVVGAKAAASKAMRRKQLLDAIRGQANRGTQASLPPRIRHAPPRSLAQQPQQAMSVQQPQQAMSVQQMQQQPQQARSVQPTQQEHQNPQAQHEEQAQHVSTSNVPGAGLLCPPSMQQGGSGGQAGQSSGLQPLSRPAAGYDMEVTVSQRVACQDLRPARIRHTDVLPPVAQTTNGRGSTSNEATCSVPLPAILRAPKAVGAAVHRSQSTGPRLQGAQISETARLHRQSTASSLLTLMGSTCPAANLAVTGSSEGAFAGAAAQHPVAVDSCAGTAVPSACASLSSADTSRVETAAAEVVASAVRPQATEVTAQPQLGPSSMSIVQQQPCSSGSQLHHPRPGARPSACDTLDGETDATHTQQRDQADVGGVVVGSQMPQSGQASAEGSPQSDDAAVAQAAGHNSSAAAQTDAPAHCQTAASQPVTAAAGTLVRSHPAPSQTAAAVRCAAMQRSLVQHLLAQNVASPEPAKPPSKQRSAAQGALGALSQNLSVRSLMNQAVADQAGLYQGAGKQPREKSKRSGPVNQYRKGQTLAHVQPLGQLQLQPSAAAAAANMANLRPSIAVPSEAAMRAGAENIPQASENRVASGGSKSSGPAMLTAKALRELVTAQIKCSGIVMGR